MTSTRSVARTTWEAAARRAEGAPDRRLPCPGCAVSVKGSGLAAHVHKVHLSGPGDMAPGHPVHIGRDRALRRTIGWASAVGVLALVALGAVDPHRAGALAIVGLVALVALALAARVGRARLVVTHQEVVLGHRLGTGTRRVALPAPLEAGRLVRRVGGGDGEGSGTVDPVRDERVGSYLRVGEGRRAITVGCPRGTRERKHWVGWSPGRARRRWDITLSPTEFVAFQYALADAAVIVPT